MLDTIKTAEHASALYAAHGDRAEAEVARKMRECSTAGKTQEAEHWKSVRMALHQLRGPNQG